MRCQILAVVTVVVLWQQQLALAKKRAKFAFVEPRLVSKEHRLDYCDDCSKSFRLSKYPPYFRFKDIEYRYALVSSYCKFYL